MASLILRPTPRGQTKHSSNWKIAGPWGERTYPPMTRAGFCETIRGELVANGLLTSGDRSRKDVTLLIGDCSFKDGKWRLD
jgi:hypothetical protein